MRSRVVFDSFPQFETQDEAHKKFTEEDIPAVVFSLKDPIRGKILNYSKFVGSLELDQDNNFESIPCVCNTVQPEYINTHHQHVLTGDLKFVQNNQLRSILQKGPKFREPQKVDFEDAYKKIDEALSIYCEKVSSKKGIPGHLVYP